MDPLDRFAALDDDDEAEAPSVGVLPRDVQSELTLLDSFAAPQDLPPVAALPSSSGFDPHLQVVNPALLLEESGIDDVPADLARPETRGRKRGSTAHEASLKRLVASAPESRAGPVEHRTRQEICREAGKASAKKRAEKASAQSSNAATTLAASSSSSCRSLAPILTDAAEKRHEVPLSRQERLQQIMAVEQPEQQQQKSSTRIEYGVLQNTLKFMSKELLAKKLKTSRRTITRRMRLLAFCLFLVRSFWPVEDLTGFDNFLFLTFGAEAVRRMCFLGKFKMDEMSMRVKLKTQNGYEFSIAKLLQVTAMWSVLWKVRDQYVRMRFSLPSRIKPIEATNTRCQRAALDQCALLPEKSKLFETQSRMHIADQHPTNTATDQTLTRDYPEEILHRLDCHAHVEYRVGGKGFDVFPSEKRGLLHVSLSCNFGGSLSLIKNGLKKQMDNMHWVDAPHGAGQAADDYREKVFEATCNPEETSAKKSKSAKTLLYCRRRRLCTGRFKRFGRFEHLCPGRHCCRDMAHCIEQCHVMVEEELGPQQWSTQRWTGFEDCVDFVLFWLLCHGLFEVVYLSIFCTVTAKAGADRGMLALLDGDSGAEEEDEEGHESVTHRPEQDLDLPDPVKDESYEKKQSTFRANGSKWLRSKPAGRLFVFRTIIRPQQRGLRRWIKDASLKAKRAELRRRQKGERPIYRITSAAEGRYTKGDRKAWSDMIRCESEWTILPMEYQTHELSVHAFRGLSALMCAKEELQTTVLEEQYPVKGYMLLSEAAVGNDIIAASEMIDLYNNHPCVLDFRWYDHCRKYPTVEQMISPDSKAEAILHADEADLDNVDVETGNTLIHRAVKRCLMQKLASVLDVGAQFLLWQDRSIHTDVFGEKLYPADLAKVDPDDVAKRLRGGGGGQARAFVSYHARTIRTEDGKLDLTRIWAMYREELRKDHSPLLEDLKREGKLATLARRQQVKAGKRWQTSSFGEIRARGQKRMEIDQSIRAIRQSVDSVEGTNRNEVGDLAIVPVARGAALDRQLAHHAGEAGLEGQVALLRKINRQEAKETRIAESKAMDELREGIVYSQHDLYGHDLRQLQSEFASVRTMKNGPFLDVYVQRNACSFVAQRAAIMAKGSKGALQATDKLWQTEHQLITVEGSPEQKDIPTSAKATFCSKFGGGKCVCKGPGLTARLAASALAASLCKRSPKDSKLRALLRSAWVVIRVGSGWYHIGMQYWRPRRCTLMELELVEERVWGHQVVRPLYEGTEMLASTTTAAKVFRRIDTEHPLDVQLYKLISFDRSLPNWRPDRLLTIQRLEDYCEGEWTIRFWQGREAELLIEAERQRQAREKAAAAARKRQEHGAERGSRASTRPKPQRKSAQHEATKAAAKAAQPELLPLPAPPLSGPDTNESGEDTGPNFFEPSSDEEDDKNVQLSGSDTDLDIPLAHLKNEVDRTRKALATKDTLRPGDEQWLDELDLDHPEDFDDTLALKVPKGARGAESNLLEKESDLFGSSGSGSELGGNEDPDPQSDSDQDEKPVGNAAKVPTIRAPRVPALEDRSDLQPPNCQCRKYGPPNGPPFWWGALPQGVSDSKGRVARRRAFREGLRSEADALALVETWLHVHAEPTEPSPVTHQSGDCSSSSSSSSSSDSSDS